MTDSDNATLSANNGQDLPQLVADPSSIRSRQYPEQLWLCIGSFIAFLSIVHIAKTCRLWLRKRRLEGLSDSRENELAAERVVGLSVTSALQRTFVSVTNILRIILYRVTVPVPAEKRLNLAQVGVIMGYILAIFIWEFIKCMNVTTGGKLDVQYWSLRAGSIATTQFLLILVLASKNNIVSLLTGISYEKIIILHRAAGHVCLLLVWIHFCGQACTLIVHSVLEQWVQLGILAAAAYTILALTSILPLRVRFYEVFFVSHYFNCFCRTPWSSLIDFSFCFYTIAPFIVWALDRAVRLIRIVRNNWLYMVSTPKRKDGLSGATVELVTPSVVRLIVTRKTTWRPGQCMFITIPSVSRFPLEAHPFTVASIPHPNGQGVSEPSPENPDRYIKNELVFLIRAKSGFTCHLRDFVQSQGGGPVTIPSSVYLDGPYGSPPDVNSFRHVILLAGGTGISFTLPILLDTVKKAHKWKTACRSIMFLWILPYLDELSLVSRTLYDALRASPTHLQIHIQLFVTRETTVYDFKTAGNTSEIKPDFAEKYVDTLLADDAVRCEARRPHLREILREEIGLYEVAGPAAVTDDVRKTLGFYMAGIRATLGGGPEISLHVETSAGVSLFFMAGSYACLTWRI
ncbi:hypothetical protein BU17DRAFT_40806 [Hysterangium stoloniferum]|nr:hypothetical protein BU17DRAFT_40806 [Hysterangium stoloniferum]